jgi:hypothetical protein
MFSDENLRKSMISCEDRIGKKIDYLLVFDENFCEISEIYAE